MTGNPHDRLEILRVVMASKTGGNKSTVEDTEEICRLLRAIVLLGNSGRHARNSCQNYFPPPSNLLKSLL